MAVTNELKTHAQGCEKCQGAIETCPDLALFDHQLCGEGVSIFRAQPAAEEATPLKLRKGQG